MIRQHNVLEQKSPNRDQKKTPDPREGLDVLSQHTLNIILGKNKSVKHGKIKSNKGFVDNSKTLTENTQTKKPKKCIILELSERECHKFQQKPVTIRKHNTDKKEKNRPYSKIIYTKQVRKKSHDSDSFEDINTMLHRHENKHTI
jgi:2-phospho-L-lactate transferase/gluconeogenesis factor (CofD/UPF0052 family)